MNCCQCQGIEEVFSQKFVREELASYRRNGPDKTTRMLIEAIQGAGVEGMTLLDIGGGVGPVQHGLLEAGIEQVTSVDASTAYISAARNEAERRGYGNRINYRHGDFVDVAQEISPADIVTLDRVICCYHDMEKLVSLSAERARKFYGLVYPRDTWWIKIMLSIENIYYRLQRNPFRAFVHPTRAVEEILSRYEFKLRAHQKTLVWQVAVFER